jgi:predicted dehydrogenase
MDRRTFLQASLVAAASSRSWAQGANDRIRVAIIGTGIRGNEILTSWITHEDSAVVALCDVASDRLEKTAATLAAAGQKADTYGDYRRILERKDVDAVVVATPDHWHGPMTVEACQAGKDVYCEKPVAHQIAPCFAMLDAAREHKRVVQIGLQQRAWPHFQDSARLLREGLIGVPNHVVMAPPVGRGGGGQPSPAATPEAPPKTLNWEMFQGPAPRKPFVPQRLRWRGFYDYGGGNVTDWGVHLVDVMHWFLDLDTKTPLVVQAAAQYVRSAPDPERVPDTYAVTLQYEKLVATLSNAALFGLHNEPWWGNYFFGDQALLLVNRDGYEVRPRPAPTAPVEGAPKPPSPLQIGFGEEKIVPMTDVTARHIRDFLSCMRSRERPRADIAIGVNSTLPTLLAIESIKAGGRAMKWDTAARQATPV